MLKHVFTHSWQVHHKPAAFRRLCVETEGCASGAAAVAPAAFRRLCVET